MEAAKQSYSFDVILKECSLQSPDEKDSPFAYAVRVLNEFLDLTPDRLFADRFPPRPLSEFLATPCELIGKLCSRGICVLVNENDTVVGSGNSVPSARLMRTLADPNFSVEEVLCVELVKNKKKVGDLKIKMQLSSVDRDMDTRMLATGSYDICRPRDRVVNPNDMIFTLGRSGKCAMVSCITDERLGSSPEAALDGEEVVSPGGGSPAEEDNEIEAGLLKKLLSDLDVDNMGKVPPRSSGGGRENRCKCRRYSSSSDSSAFKSGDDRVSHGRKKKPSISEFEGDFTPQQLAELRSVRKRVLGACPKLPPQELNIPKYVPPVLCQVCQANITWLPKLSACPYCGYRRVDLNPPSEEAFDETATAADVLRNHVLHSQAGSGDTLSGCYLVAGDISPSAADSSQTQKIKVKDAKPAPEKAAAARQKELNPEEYRRQLVKIFTEMRDAYKKKTLNEQATEKALMCCDEFAGKGTKKRLSKRSAVTQKLLEEIERAYPTQKKKAKAVKPKNTRRRKRSRYTFIVREDPLRPKQAHKTCAQSSDRVPSHMGWMWNKCIVGHNRCWKPGTIRKPIRALMEYFLKDYPLDSMGYSRSHHRNSKPPAAVEDEPLIQYPTLHIHKKHDEYTITLRPLKDPKSLAVAANPYANMRPVVFRISKDPYATGIRNLKQELIRKGYPLCTCHQPVANCYCRTHVDQKVLVHEVSKLSRAQGLKDISESFVYSDLSESDSENELEFGVTPPAGVVKPERLIKRHLINCETQYDESDWATTSMYPHPPTALVQYSGCVMGERKGRFPWILGKGPMNQGAEPPKPKRSDKSKGKAQNRLRGGSDAYFGKRVWHKSNDPTSNQRRSRLSLTSN